MERFTQRELRVLMKAEEMLRDAAEQSAAAEIDSGELEFSKEARARLLSMPRLIRPAVASITIGETAQLARTLMRRRGASFARNSQYGLGRLSRGAVFVGACFGAVLADAALRKAHINAANDIAARAFAAMKSSL